MTINSISNATATVTSGTLGSGEEVIITLICDDGYIIESAPTLSFWNEDGDYYSVRGVITSDTTATYTLSATSGHTDDAVYTFGGGAIVQTTFAETTVTDNTTGGATLTYEEASDTSVTITLTGTQTATQARFFDLTVNYTNTDGESVTGEFSVADDTTQIATVTLIDVDKDNVVTVTGRYVSVYCVAYNLTYCSTDEVYYVELGESLTLTVTPNAGYTLTTLLASWYDGYGDYNETTGNTDTGVITITSDEAVTITINAIATPAEVVGGNYGAINVYVVTLDILEQFSKVRFATYTTESNGETTATEVDLGEYVNRIRRIFTNVQTENTDVMRCGNYSTGIVCDLPNQNIITLDFGNVEITPFNGDTVDFQGDISIYLPFAGYQAIPIDYVGKTINVQLLVNVITGNGLYRLSSDGINFATYDAEPFDNILYRIVRNNDFSTFGDDATDNILQEFEPFVIMKHYNSITQRLHNDSTLVVIGETTGKGTFTNVEGIHSSLMLASEQEEIINLLASGVCIED